MRSLLEAGLYELTLSGLPASSQFQGNQFTHLVGMAPVGFGAGVFVGRFRIGLDLQASFVGPWVTGLVVGEPAVRPYGACVGGEMTAGIVF